MSWRRLSFNINTIVRSTSIRAIVDRHPIIVKDLLRNINFLNLHTINSLRDVPKVVIYVSWCFLNILSLRNKTSPVANYFIWQSIDLLSSIAWNDTYQLIINVFLSIYYEFDHISGKSSRRGGCVDLLYRTGLAARMIKTEIGETYTHFETWIYFNRKIINKMIPGSINIAYNIPMDSDNEMFRPAFGSWGRGGYHQAFKQVMWLTI